MLQLFSKAFLTEYSDKLLMTLHELTPFSKGNLPITAISYSRKCSFIFNFSLAVSSLPQSIYLSPGVAGCCSHSNEHYNGSNFTFWYRFSLSLQVLENFFRVWRLARPVWNVRNFEGIIPRNRC